MGAYFRQTEPVLSGFLDIVTNPYVGALKTRLNGEKPLLGYLYWMSQWFVGDIGEKTYKIMLSWNENYHEST